jgi:anti-sigma factor RsiW
VPNADEPVTPCPELPRVHALADGELHGLEAACVRRHARRCAECRSELAFLRQLAVAVAAAVAARLLPER